MEQQIAIDISAGTVHKLTRQAFESGKKVIIHKGGTGSGKTYDIMIFLILYVAMRNPNQIITVVSESHPHLNIGVIRLSNEILQNAGLQSEVKFNVNKNAFTFPNETILEFFSADRIDRALGARRDVLFGNEINSLKVKVWDELARRSELIIGDFNPTAEFWLEEWMQYYDDVVIHKTNYKVNRYLKPTERDRIIKRAAMDENFRRIHIDCEYGVYEGLVFTEWHQVDEIPEGGITMYGLDFGYTNDPSALVKVVVKDQDMYVDEIFYSTGLTNQAIRSRIALMNIRTSQIIADSAEPKSIDEIKFNAQDNYGHFNIKPAVKGADSIVFGIDKIRQHRMFVTKRSVNLIKELRSYSWSKGRDGKPTNRPIDAWNHGIDAIRYAISTYKPDPDLNKIEGIFF